MAFSFPVSDNIQTIDSHRTTHITMPVTTNVDKHEMADWSVPVGATGSPKIYTTETSDQKILGRTLGKTTTLNIDLVPDYLFYAIFSTFLCFPPVGLIATYKAALSLKALGKGDYVKAKILSDQARCFIFITVACGNAIYVTLIFTLLIPLAKRWFNK